MRTQLARDLGLEFPIFAFSHCRDVVAAVSRAGGMGVLGALYFTPEELEIELKWIDEHVDGKPYGVDLVMPAKVELPEGVSAGDLEGQLEQMISPEHREWVEKVLAEHGVPPLPEDSGGHHLLGWTDATARPQIDIAFQHSPALQKNTSGALLSAGSLPRSNWSRLRSNLTSLALFSRFVHSGIDGSGVNETAWAPTLLVLTPRRARKRPSASSASST